MRTDNALSINEKRFPMSPEVKNRHRLESLVAEALYQEWKESNLSPEAFALCLGETPSTVDRSALRARGFHRSALEGRGLHRFLNADFEEGEDAFEILKAVAVRLDKQIKISFV